MSKSQRTKGQSGEREVVNILREAGYPDAARNLEQTRDGGRDVVDCPPLCVEVKRQEKLQLRAAYEQCLNAARQHEVATVIHRSNRTPWLVTLSLKDFLDLLAEGGYTQ